MASEADDARFRHLIQQRDAKQAEIIRLMTQIDGITVALDELLDGNSAKAAHIDVIGRLMGQP